jgi:hypothetical protein
MVALVVGLADKRLAGDRVGVGRNNQMEDKASNQ